MELRGLMAQTQHLPAIPALVQSLIDSLGREDISLPAIGRLITTDPGLSARLLRLANSAYFRSARAIGTVEDALKFLGVKMARNLVIGSGLAAACKPVPGMVIEEFWRYSLATAGLARWLARLVRHDAELGFMVGLLHGIGQFVMRSAMPQDMLRIDSSVHPLAARRAAAEREAFGFDHAEAGAELARLWRFPETIAQGVESVPAPLAAQPASPAAALVHIAAWRARAEIMDEVPDQMLASGPTAAAASIGLEERWLAALASAGTGSDGANALPDIAGLTAGLEQMIGATPRAR